MIVHIGYAVILPIHDFDLRGKKIWHMYKYVLKQPFRQDIEMPCLEIMS